MKKSDSDQAKFFSFAKLIIFLLLVVSISGFIWYFINYQNAKKQILYLSTPEAWEELAKKEVDSLLDNIGRHIILKKGEDPMIATISDIDSLISEQEFYKDAKNGDKLIIYSDRAIIYDPDKDVIVNVGPVYNQNQPETTSEEEQENNNEAKSEIKPVEDEITPLNLDIRNGSKTVGIAKELMENLNSQDQYNVIGVSNAKSQDYKNNILVNLTNKDVSAIEKELRVKAVAAMPEGEKESSADIVLILGNN